MVIRSLYLCLSLLSLSLSLRKRKEEGKRGGKKLLVTLPRRVVASSRRAGKFPERRSGKNAAAFRALLGTSSRKFSPRRRYRLAGIQILAAFRRNTTRRAGPVQGWYCANRGCTCGSAKFRRSMGHRRKPWKFSFSTNVINSGGWLGGEVNLNREIVWSIRD